MAAKAAKAKAAKPASAAPPPKAATRATRSATKAKVAAPPAKAAKATLSAATAKPKQPAAKAKAKLPAATAKRPSAKATRAAKPATHAAPPPLTGISSPPAARALLLVDGAAFGAATLALVPLPALRLTSGALVACDPLDVHGPAFARRLARGTYDVVAAVATYPGKHGPGEQVVAALILAVAPAAPVAWEPATFADEPDADDPAYRADSGAACFMDLHLQVGLAAEPSTFPTASYRALERQLLDEHHAPTWGWAIYPEPPTAAGCVAVLGGSSLTRRSYWGLDANGAVACLLTDLETFPADVWAAVSPRA